MADTLKIIRKAVGQGMKSAGMTKPCVLIRITPTARAAGAATGGRLPGVTRYPARGLATTEYSKVNETQVEQTDRVVKLFGDLVAVKPRVGDKVEYDGNAAQSIVDIEHAAAEATYICLCRG